METVKLLLVVVLLVASADAWWLAKEQHSYHACGAALEVFLGDTCKAKWYQNCSSDSCRRRRALDDVLANQEDAKAFLRARRERRAVWSLYEECCKEGCRTEEVREHC